MLDTDADIAAARDELARANALDELERIAWGAASWRGQVSLHVPGTAPLLVTIEPFRTSEHVGVSVGFDNEVRKYSLAELAAAARNPYLDETERTMWALVARRARRAIDETFADARDS